MSLNQCQFIGNLGADPEIRSFGDGNQVANMRLAVSEKWRDKNTGEQRERTEWVSVAVFGGLVRVVEQYLRKGSKVYISGQMQTRKWQDQEGRDRYTTEIVLRGPGSKLEMLDGPQQRSERQSNGQAEAGAGGYGGGHGSGGQAGLDDEIPF